MKDNLEKVLERDANLTSLENRTGIFSIDEKKKRKLFQTNNYLFFRCFTNWCITIYNKC